MYKDHFLKLPFLTRGKFVPSEILTLSEDVVKSIDKHGDVPEVRYSNVNGNVYITGYFKDEHTFHISTIWNEGNDEYGILSKVFLNLEEDLKKTGINTITTFCLYKLVPIAIRRYGFHFANKTETLESVKKERQKWLSLSNATMLEKNL